MEDPNDASRSAEIALRPQEDRQEVRSHACHHQKRRRRSRDWRSVGTTGCRSNRTIKGDRVRVAFEFPRKIEVHRREVADQIVNSGEDANSVLGKIRPAAE